MKNNTGVMTNNSTTQNKAMNLMLCQNSKTSAAKNVKTEVSCDINIGGSFDMQSTSPSRRPASRTSVKPNNHATYSPESRAQLNGAECTTTVGTGYGAQNKGD